MLNTRYLSNHKKHITHFYYNANIKQVFKIKDQKTI